MSLDKIPEIDWEVVETHCHDRYRSPDEFQRWRQQVEEHLEHNPHLSRIIWSIANKSENPGAIYRTAFTILDLVNAQLEVNELNEDAQISYIRR